MSTMQGHQATMNGKVSIERLIGRRERLKKVLGRAEGNSAPNDLKRASLQSELDTIETALASYKAALADL